LRLVKIITAKPLLRRRAVRSRIFTTCLNVAILAVWTGAGWAHGPVDRVAEGSDAEARMFFADAANGDLVSVDLPAGAEMSRLSTPPYIMSLG
jgi:hypothetical protein